MYGMISRFASGKIRRIVLFGMVLSILGFSVLGGISYRYLLQIEDALALAEVVDDLSSEILEIRRYEKNYLLYMGEADYVETLRYCDSALGIIDRIGINPGQETVEADLVLIATPVGQMPEIMARIAPYLGPETVVTDGGSTKSDVVAAVREHLGERAGQFVPAHPIAGAENSGAAALPPKRSFDVGSGSSMVTRMVTLGASAGK